MRLLYVWVSVTRIRRAGAKAALQAQLSPTRRRCPNSHGRPLKSAFPILIELSLKGIHITHNATGADIPRQRHLAADLTAGRI